MSTALQTYPQLGRATAPGEAWSILGGFITWATAISVLPHVIMRVYSARDVASARSSLNMAMILYSIMMLLTAFVLVPLAATTLTVDESKDPDGLFFTLTASVFNTFGQGIVAAAVLAAIMSTTAGLLMACNSAIAHDLFRGVIRPEASQRTTLRVASAATVVVGLICMILALNPPQLLIVLYTGAVALLASAFFAPMVLGIWWSRTTRAGATAGLLAGAVSFTIAFVMDLPTSAEVLVGLPVSIVVTVAVSLMTSHSETETAPVPSAVPEEARSRR
ncbi:sodium:solute symporter family protein [Mobilicoccus caccae]|uniref:Sodium:solute symporter family protein n=1 Tax=Mobilicoccus caccae TaxID=1859295 RepID=A0ABQ6IT12_9MICO|nr:hypothetical protein [Mobilicoccus caccae]GMA40624.1 hypothetical protein GCM10025883_26690 [Mobilicoccus caccae]